MEGSGHLTRSEKQASATGTTTGAAESERDPRGQFAPGNSHRWVPGKSGNPGGRPRGASFAAALARQA